MKKPLCISLSKPLHYSLFSYVTRRRFLVYVSAHLPNISFKFNISRRRIKSSLVGGLHKNCVCRVFLFAKAVTESRRRTPCQCIFLPNIGAGDPAKLRDMSGRMCGVCVTRTFSPHTFSWAVTRRRACKKPARRKREDGRVYFCPRACVHMYTSGVCRKGGLRGNHYGVKALPPRKAPAGRKYKTRRRRRNESKWRIFLCKPAGLLAGASLLRFHFAPLQTPAPFC
jgi:hypothetical protein